MTTIDILTSLKTLLKVSHIEYGVNQNHLLGNQGEIVVYPESEEDIQCIIRYANDNSKKITVVGMGTKKGFGGLESSTDILLSLEKYQGIIEHSVGDMTITVKAGTRFLDLQKYLRKTNQMISLDPAWPEYATIGGVIASNESGAKRLSYGSARDLVIGMKVIYPNGDLIRLGGKVVKNVAGYDMNKLFIGSMGTLGVITEVTIKLKPLPKYESLILLSFPDGDLEDVRLLAVNMLDSMMEPVSLELLNPTISKNLTGYSYYTLVISFEDVESSVHYQEEFVKSISPTNTILTTIIGREIKTFWDKFYNLHPNGLSAHESKETKAVLKISVNNFDVLYAIKESQLLADINNIEVQSHGGLGHGICQVSLSGSSEDIVSAIQSLRKAIEKIGGYVVIKHLPLSLRQIVNVWGDNPSYFPLLKGIKFKVDPNNTLNHRRFVGGL